MSKKEVLESGCTTLTVRGLTIGGVASKAARKPSFGFSGLSVESSLSLLLFPFSAGNCQSLALMGVMSVGSEIDPWGCTGLAGRGGMSS